MQLAVLELFRKACKYDPTQKSRLMKAIFFFSKSKSSSVLFECANTLTQISNSPTTLKLSTNIYVQLLLTLTDNNVKLILLDKLQQILDINPRFLEDQVFDITKLLNNQSLEIRRKVIELIKRLVSEKNINSIFPLFLKELKKLAHDNEQKDFRHLLIEIMDHFVASYE